MAQKILKPTKGEKSELYELASLGREHGLDAAVKWLMAAMKKSEDQARAGKRRKRTVALVDRRGLGNLKPMAIYWKPQTDGAE